MHSSYFSGNLEEEKNARIALQFTFLVSQKLVIYKILNTLKLFWFAIDSSVLLNEEDQFFYFFCLYCWLYKIIWKDYIKGSLNISAHLSMKIILVDPNIVRILFGNNIYGEHP